MSGASEHWRLLVYWLHSHGFLFQMQDSKSEKKLAFYSNDKITELTDSWNYLIIFFHNEISPGKQVV